jgi:ribosomal protein L11 methyltransferase
MFKPSSTYCLSVIVPNSRYDIAVSIIHALDMLGCEEQSVPDGIKLAVYFKDEETARMAAESLKDQIQTLYHAIVKVENQDWNAKWRASMKPARIARGWYVSPLWLPPPESARHWIKIEPKMAFGTGHHETTRLASQAIIAEIKRVKNRRVLDIGCGSGVLCFVAGRCGAASCVGVELDECCRENLAENLHENRPDGHIGFIMGSADSLKEGICFSIIVMNMIMAESSPLLDKIARLLAPEGRFIWSGILNDEYRDAIALARRSGFEIILENTENEWWCGVFIKQISKTT